MNADSWRVGGIDCYWNNCDGGPRNEGCICLSFVSVMTQSRRTSCQMCAKLRDAFRCIVKKRQKLEPSDKLFEDYGFLIFLRRDLVSVAVGATWEANWRRCRAAHTIYFLDISLITLMGSLFDLCACWMFSELHFCLHQYSVVCMRPPSLLADPCDSISPVALQGRSPNMQMWTRADVIDCKWAHYKPPVELWSKL